MRVPITEKPYIEFDMQKRILVKENVLPINVCDDIIQYGLENAQKGINKYPSLFEISFDACLLPLGHDVHDMLQEVWGDVINTMDISAEFVEPYELKRYTTGDFFGKHTDHYMSLSKDIDRKITASIQLSSNTDYTGGELMIFNQQYTITQGSIVFFPSYFSHEVKPITSGTRWSLITWAWGPHWR